MILKEDFISQHLEICQARPCKQYDNKGKGAAGNTTKYHSLAYSRRKCAKKNYKSYLKYLKNQ